jgi:subfamily B ATP-binding cassette protein MsbA
MMAEGPMKGDIPAGASRGAEEFQPAAFARRLARRYWPLLAVVLVCMGTYSAFTAMRLAVGGLVVDVTKYLLEKRVAPASERWTLEVDLIGNYVEDRAPSVVKGKVLSGFEGYWDKWIGSPAPTAKIEEPRRFYRFLIGLGVVAVLASLAMGVSYYLKEFLAQRFVLAVIADVRQAIVDHLVLQSLAFFNRQRAGDLLSRVTNDVVSLNVTLRLLFETVVQEPITIAGCLVILFSTSWTLTLMILPFYALLLVPIFRTGRKVKKYGRTSLEKLGEVTEDLQQLFTGIRTVKAFGMEEHERRDFEEKNRGYVRKTLKMARAKITGRTFQEVGYNVGVAVLIFFLGALLFSKVSNLDAGQFAMFVMALIQIYQPVKAVSKALNQLQESRGGYDRILGLLRSARPIPDPPDAFDFPGVRDEIRFDEVSFSYDSPPGAPVLHGPPPASPGPEDGCPARPVVLREISFSVKAGQVVAVVGPSGAGKSTLVDLLARFYDPTKGRILIDGIDVRRYRRDSYLRAVAIVSQDPFLFNATIEENIAYGRAGAAREDVVEAARKADAHEFILEQPEGYETRIGERGVLLSGGQRQRLTIARAILKDAPILILDEATSALDTAAEKEVQRALENLMEHRTTFIIAHRLSTIVHADRILVLDEGRIVESGNHEDLLALRGRYWELVSLQGAATR